MPAARYDHYLEVNLDGRLCGYILRTETKQFINRLRIMKVQEQVMISMVEIVLTIVRFPTF